MTPRFNTPSPPSEEGTAKSDSPTGAEKMVHAGNVKLATPRGSASPRGAASPAHTPGAAPIVAGAAAWSQQFAQLRRDSNAGSVPALRMSLPFGLGGGATNNFPILHRSVSSGMKLGPVAGLGGSGSAGTAGLLPGSTFGSSVAAKVPTLGAALNGAPVPATSAPADAPLLDQLQAPLVSTPIVSPRKPVGAVLAPLGGLGSSSFGGLGGLGGLGGGLGGGFLGDSPLPGSLGAEMAYGGEDCESATSFSSIVRHPSLDLGDGHAIHGVVGPAPSDDEAEAEEDDDVISQPANAEDDYTSWLAF